MHYRDLSSMAGLCVLSQGCLGGTRAEGPWMGMSRGCPIHPPELFFWSHCTVTLGVSAASSPLPSSSHLVHASSSPTTLPLSFPSCVVSPGLGLSSFCSRNAPFFHGLSPKRLGGSRWMGQRFLLWALTLANRSPHDVPLPLHCPQKAPCGWTLGQSTCGEGQC